MRALRDKANTVSSRPPWFIHHSACSYKRSSGAFRILPARATERGSRISTVPGEPRSPDPVCTCTYIRTTANYRTGWRARSCTSDRKEARDAIRYASVSQLQLQPSSSFARGQQRASGTAHTCSDKLGVGADLAWRPGHVTCTSRTTLLPLACLARSSCRHGWLV